MKIYSGSFCFCDTGRPTGFFDIHGRELFTGDIVQLWRGSYIGTDIEEWMPSDGLTAIVADQYRSYSNGNVDLLDDEAPAFTMGIKDTGVCGGDWRVSLVKSHRDIIAGERIIAYGFNYRD